MYRQSERRALPGIRFPYPVAKRDISREDRKCANTPAPFHLLHPPRCMSCFSSRRSHKQAQTTGYRPLSMSKTMGFPEVTRLYPREVYRLRYGRRARATERAPGSILHRVHKRFYYVLCDWLTPRQFQGSISLFQRPGPGKAVRLLIKELCFRAASTMTRH